MSACLSTVSLRYSLPRLPLSPWGGAGGGAVAPVASDAEHAPPDLALKGEQQKSSPSGNDPLADVRLDRHSVAMKRAKQARLNEAVDAVYKAFAQTPPDVIEGCPCCISTRGVDVLLTTPLRSLTGKQLWRYVSGAFLTVGGETDFRYLLPRIFEISATDAANANDPEIVIGKLALANWRTWATKEQVVSEEFIDAWFECAVIRDLAEAGDGWIGSEAESVLCGAARAGMPLLPWLVRLHDPLLALLLTDLKEQFPGGLSPFWEDAPKGFAELSTILTHGQA